MREFLEKKLKFGPVRLGQVIVRANYVLNHFDDCGREDLRTLTDPHEMLAVVRYDDAGRYRPLKTAPNLAHGWCLRLADLESVLLALDFIYPAGVGTARSWAAGDLRPVSLPTTLERQSGLYAVTKKLTEAEADEVVGSLCRPGCLRHILWNGSGGPNAVGSSEIPLLCAEACNLFVAEARKVVKARATDAGGG